MVNIYYTTKCQIFFIKSTFLILMIIIGLSIFLRFYYSFYLDSWFDEWNMLYTVDPNVSNEELGKRFFGDRGGGWLSTRILSST